MVKDEIHSILSDTRQLLEEKEFEKAEILYVLENTEDIKESISGVCDKNNEMYEVILKNKKVKYCYDWDYNVDEYIFGNIEKEYNIGFMTMEFHRAIWTSIGSVDIEEIQHKLGLQKYLKYCKDNNIDKDIIKRETKPDDIPDIMKFYDEKTNYVTMENGQVQMSNEKYQEQSDVSYIAFVLGYDLLNEMITNSEVKECDINYDFCNYLARKFIETDYYKDEWHSTYDNLRDWVEDNTDNIKSEHLFFTGKDNKVIIDTGKRNNEPVALVEHCFKDGTKEYIVAFLSNTLGYWYPGYYEFSYVMYENYPPESFAEPLERKTIWDSQILKRYYESVCNSDFWRETPVLRLFFVPGFTLWFLLYALALAWKKRRFFTKVLPLFLPLIAQYGIMILSPMSSFRYSWPFYLMLPLAFIGICEKRSCEY